MLGTLGCVPAYDRFFKVGLNEKGIHDLNFNQDSLNKLFDFIKEKKNEIKVAQESILSKTKNYYPIMKIVDMYFWQIGYDKELEKKNS